MKNRFGSRVLASVIASTVLTAALSAPAFAMSNAQRTSEGGGKWVGPTIVAIVTTVGSSMATEELKDRGCRTFSECANTVGEGSREAITKVERYINDESAPGDYDYAGAM